MSVIVLQADSTTLILNNYSFTQFGEGDYLTLTPVNAASSHVNSSSGGVTISENMGKDTYDLVVRVQKYGQDDVQMLGIVNAETIQVQEGSVKQSYSSDGQAGVESWILEGGSVTTQPTQTKNNVDGNALMEYTLRFRTAKRSL